MGIISVQDHIKRIYRPNVPCNSLFCYISGVFQIKGAPQGELGGGNNRLHL